MEIKKIGIGLVGIILPIFIFASSVVALKYPKDYYLAKNTRNSTQLMYLGATILGVTGYWFHNRHSILYPT
jgi:hypothetical protein